MSIMIRESTREYSILAGKRAICSGVSESRGSEIKEGGGGGKEAQKFSIQSVL